MVYDLKKFHDRPAFLLGLHLNLADLDVCLGR